MDFIGNEWDKILESEFKKKYFVEFWKLIEREYETSQIFPVKGDIFRALTLANYNDVKLMIMGQDPYYRQGQADGLCFSVKDGVKIPKSLLNIFKELESDMKIPRPSGGNLAKWAAEGVLLLNSILTVKEGMPNYYKGFGWEKFTDAVISALNRREKPVIFLLWGANAHDKERLITNPIHTILKAAHPSPLSASRGFFGCKHFSKANAILSEHGIEPINWDLN